MHSCSLPACSQYLNTRPIASNTALPLGFGIGSELIVVISNVILRHCGSQNSWRYCKSSIVTEPLLFCSWFRVWQRTQISRTVLLHQEPVDSYLVGKLQLAPPTHPTWRVHLHWRIKGDSRDARPLLDPISFIFTQFSAKTLPSNNFLLSPLGPPLIWTERKRTFLWSFPRPF